jgi:hypothetical protein
VCPSASLCILEKKKNLVALLCFKLLDGPTCSLGTIPTEVSQLCSGIYLLRVSEVYQSK